MRELKRNKIIYVALYRKKDDLTKFLGDFEINLTGMFMEDYEE